MSINWHHFKTIQRKIGVQKETTRLKSGKNVALLWPKNPTGTQNDLKVFNKYMADERKRP